MHLLKCTDDREEIYILKVKGSIEENHVEKSKVFVSLVIEVCCAVELAIEYIKLDRITADVHQ